MRGVHWSEGNWAIVCHPCTCAGHQVQHWEPGHCIRLVAEVEQRPHGALPLCLLLCSSRPSLWGARAAVSGGGGLRKNLSTAIQTESNSFWMEGSQGISLKFIARRCWDWSWEELPAATRWRSWVGWASIHQRNGSWTHRNVPDGTNREYLKSQNPAEWNEKGRFGAVNVVHAFPDPSDEQRGMLIRYPLAALSMTWAAHCVDQRK